MLIKTAARRRWLVVCAMLGPLLTTSACAVTPEPPLATPPTSAETTSTHRELITLPAPERQAVVAVYNFPDLTGQYKPSMDVQTYSRAVTQGAAWILVKALKDAGGGAWFRVIQRVNLDNLLKERAIIRETRVDYAQQTGTQAAPLPPLLFAGVILEGGIIGFDSNTQTGGIGARYLGIGGDTEYRQDTVTVYLNAVSSQTGEILRSVVSRKTIVSQAVSASVFRFVSFKELLEAEAGYTVNEPGQVALTQAIEHAVRALILEGAEANLWGFKDVAAGGAEIWRYEHEKSRQETVTDGDLTVRDGRVERGRS
jgi:curli production assembly/transport component CsgG